MELYTLDALLRRKDVIDTWVSLIWTERYAAEGDFTLTIPADGQIRRLLQNNVMLSSNVSDRIMVVKSVEDKTDSDGSAILTVKGFSLETIFRDRFVKKTLQNTTVDKEWEFWDFPQNILNTVFVLIYYNSWNSASDTIPFLQVDQKMYPTPNIPLPEEAVHLFIKLQSLYDLAKTICEDNDLGFRLTRGPDTSKLYFEVYTGNDRTIQQTVLPAVVISPDLENMRDTTEFTTYNGNKNVCYVFSPVGVEIVYSQGAGPSTSSFDRQVMSIDASDITDTDPVVASQKMIQKGKDALMANRPLYAFDGEIDPYLDLVYGKDYMLGDLITVQSSSGTVTSMKVTEQIFVSDKEGERAYPTLSVRSVINAGSWLAWNYNQVWADMATEHWSDI